MPSACCRHINELDPDGRFYVLCRWQRCKNSLRMTTRRPRLWVAGKKHARFVASSRETQKNAPGVPGDCVLKPIYTEILEINTEFSTKAKTVFDFPIALGCFVVDIFGQIDTNEFAWVDVKVRTKAQFPITTGFVIVIH